MAPTFSIPGASAASVVHVCGKVVNSAGWAIPGATVTFTSYNPTIASPAERITDADGFFDVPDVHTDNFYVVTIRPPTTAPGYRPWSSLVDTPSEPVFDADAQPDTTCQPSGAPGKALQDGTVTLASPGQGYLEVTVRDAAVVGAPGLAGVNVATGIASATTDATGRVRLPCTEGVTSLLAAKDPTYLSSARSDQTCSPTAPASVTIQLWRKPIIVAVEVTDAASRAAPAPGAPTLETGIEGATVSVARAPAPLRALSGAGAPCSAATPGPDKDVFVASTDDNPPYRCSATTDALGTATLAIPWGDSAATSFRVVAEKTSFQKLAKDADYTSGGLTSVVVTTADASRDTNPAAATPTVANHYLRFSMLPATPEATTTPVTVSGTVIDFTGAGVGGVDIQFDGPTLTHVTTSSAAGSEGAFTVSLDPAPAASPYKLTLVHPDFNVRTCTASVAAASGLTIESTNGVDNPVEYCFRLVGVDKSAVNGTTIDPYTNLPIPGLRFCASDGTCADTDVAGEYAMEVTAGSSISMAPGSDWVPQSASPTILRDQFLAYPTGPGTPDMLLRTTRTVTFVAKDATTDAVVANAIMCIRGPTPSFIPSASLCTFSSNTRKTTGTAGAGLAVTQVAWTQRAGDPTFDVGPIQVIQSGRHTQNPHYSNTTATFHVMSDDPASTTLTVLLTEEPTSNTAVTAVDDHTGAPIAGPTVTASIKTLSGVTLVCGKVCAPSGTTLTLYNDRDGFNTERTYTEGHNYSVAVAKASYVTNGTPATILPGTPSVAVSMPRTTSYALVQVFDAHTGAPLEGASVRVVGGSAAPSFKCDPPGAPQETTPTTYTRACSGTTLPNGTVTPDVPSAVTTLTSNNAVGFRLLNLPWSTTPNEECILVEAGTYAVNLVNATTGNKPVSSFQIGGDAAAQKETVAFQATTSCLLVPQGLPRNQAVTHKVYVSRAPTTISGSVTDFNGDPIQDADVEPKSERPYPGPGNPGANPGDPLAYSPFQCDPAKTNSSVAFPECAGVATPANGEFSLTLPATAESKTHASAPSVPDDTWSLNVSADGYFPARFPRIEPGATDLVLDLWPATFDLVVNVTEDSGASPCAASFTGDIPVTVRDLETGETRTVNAQRGGPDNTCVAVFPGFGWKRYLDAGVSVDPNGVEGTPDDTPIAKTTDVYLINTTYGGRQGAFPFQLGPKAYGANLTVSSAKVPTVFSFLEVGYISGTVRDADALADGVPGVIVTAAKEGDACFATPGLKSYSTVTGPDGKYAIPVTCTGTFKVNITSQAAGIYDFSAVREKTVHFQADGVMPAQDFQVQRVRSVLTVTAQDALSLEPRPGVSVSVALIGGAATVAPIVTGADGKATFAGVPWGAYAITATPATGHGAATMAVVLPGQNADATVLIVTTIPSTTPGAPIAGKVVDDDAATHARVTIDSTPVASPVPTGPGVPGVIVTATKQGPSCTGNAPSTFRAVTDHAGAYSIAIPAGCSGTYVMHYDHPGRAVQTMYLMPADKTIAHDANAGTGTNAGDARVTRVRATLTLDPFNVTNGGTGIRHTVIDPQPVDVSASQDPAAQTYDTGQHPTWSLPWGFYHVVAQPPNSSPLTNPIRGTHVSIPQLLFVPPGASLSAYCLVVYVPRG